MFWKVQIAQALKPLTVQVYALEGSVAIAGVGITWLKDNLGILNDPSESEEVPHRIRSELLYTVTRGLIPDRGANGWFLLT